MRRPVVLTFVGAYLPGYRAGGPIRSIVNLVEELGDALDFRVVTADRDLGDRERYPEVSAHRWVQVGNAQVLYVAPSLLGKAVIAELVWSGTYDVLYLNSFFNPAFSFLPMIARSSARRSRRRRLVIAPKGEFSASALKMKRWKKVPYAAMLRGLRVFEDATWHASSSFEAADIVRVIGSGSQVHVAPDIASAGGSLRTPDIARKPDDVSPLRILFLSRISPMKNLEFAIEAVARAKTHVDFSIVGPIEDQEYWTRCLALNESLRGDLDLDYRGAAKPNEVQQVLADADLLLLPTNGEAFGHVIAEALSVGTPVLISDRTPWRNLEREGFGWDLPLEDLAPFARAIEHLASKTNRERDNWRRQIIDRAGGLIHPADVRERNLSLFFRPYEDQRLRPIGDSDEHLDV